jgi:hypothetical protein
MITGWRAAMQKNQTAKPQRCQDKIANPLRLGDFAVQLN